MTEVKIGLEIHLSLNKNIKTKLFCGCALPNENSKPNTHCCPICLGLPGAKPVVNQVALQHAVKLAMALGCKIQDSIVFSRKSYFYPDLPSNYQVTQYEVPLGVGGQVVLSSGDVINLTRVHVEEDPGALIHPKGVGQSPFVLIDYNRSGTALIEIVTEPDMHSAAHARDFLNRLLEIVKYLEIFDIKTGTIKADANISIRESGFVRAEIKNISGFKDIERALQYEIVRQSQAFKNNEKIVQETRGWDSVNGTTYSLRSKETEADYGYIIDPNLTAINTKDFVKKVKLPELPYEKAKRFVKKFKLSEDDAKVITAEMELAFLFEKVAEKISPVFAAKWLRRELVKLLKEKKKGLSEVNLDEKEVVSLLDLLEKNQITDLVFKELMEKLLEKRFDVKKYVKDKDLVLVSDTKKLEKICNKVIKENPTVVADFKNGKSKALNFLVGKVMRETKGKTSPHELAKIFKKLLK